MEAADEKATAVEEEKPEMLQGAVTPTTARQALTDDPQARAREPSFDDGQATPTSTPNSLLAVVAPNVYAYCMPKKRPLSRQLRDAVNDCGLTRYQISKQTGIPQSTLSRFVRQERELSFDVMDRLGEFLGIELVVCGPAKPATKRKGK